MATVEVTFQGAGQRGAFADQAEAGKLQNSERPIRIAGASGGLLNQFAIVAIGLTLPDGQGIVLAQTSLEAFLNAADMLKEHYGDPRQKGRF